MSGVKGCLLQMFYTLQPNRKVWKFPHHPGTPPRALRWAASLLREVEDAVPRGAGAHLLQLVLQRAPRLAPSGACLRAREYRFRDIVCELEFRGKKKGSDARESLAKESCATQQVGQYHHDWKTMAFRGSQVYKNRCILRAFPTYSRMLALDIHIGEGGEV